MYSRSNRQFGPRDKTARWSALAVSVGLWLTACTSNDPAPQTQVAASASTPDPASVAVEPAVAPKPGVVVDGAVASAVAWFEGSFEQALRQAKDERKLVFVDIGAYWCPPCHKLDEEVFVAPAVADALKQDYVAVHIDAEKGEGPELAQRYNVQVYPTLLVLESSGLEKGRVVDFHPAEELLTALGRIREGDNVLAELVDDVAAHPDDISKRYALGHAYAIAAMRDRAQEQFEVVMVADPKDQLGYASQVAYDRALFFRYKLDRDLEGAIADFETLQRRYPDSPKALRAFRAIGRVRCEQGREADAVASLDKMLAQEPENPRLASSYGWFAFRHRCGAKRGLDVVDSGLRQEPSSADLHYVQAELRHMLGNDRGALDSIRQASELEPKSAFYRRQVARFEGLAGT